MKPSALSGWRRKDIDAWKVTIKKELNEVLLRDGAARRLDYIAEQIQVLEPTLEPESQLRRYIYCMSMLVHHLTYGGLSHTQVIKVATLARVILEAQNIQPKVSRLSYLHGEVHLVLSQIWRKRGSHWLAALEQELATLVSGDIDARDSAFQALAMANRAMRLGHTGLALELLESAEVDDASKHWENARLARIKVLRLSGRRDLADDLAKSTDGAALSNNGAVELQWELFCLDPAFPDNLNPMLAAVKPGKTHHKEIYILEASLWAKAIASRSCLTRVSKVKSQIKRGKLKPQRFGFFSSIVQCFDECYEVDRPLLTRIDQLGQTLIEVHQLVTIDKELLVWAAAARFFARSKSPHLASLALHEYVALSLKLTSGQERDVLGCCHDMLNRDWAQLRSAS